MAPSPLARSLGRAAGRVPGLRRVPVGKLLAIAEIGVLAREHLARLSPDERRRIIHLMGVARGRPSSLSKAQREELSRLVAKLEPRMFAGAAADKLSPVPLPKRIVRGSRKQR